MINQLLLFRIAPNSLAETERVDDDDLGWSDVGARPRNNFFLNEITNYAQVLSMDDTHATMPTGCNTVYL